MRLESAVKIFQLKCLIQLVFSLFKVDEAGRNQ